jgi:gamma-glutamyltranspeptidase
MSQHTSKKISGSLVVEASKDQVSTGIPGETVILNTRSGMYHNMEAVGSRVWELIQEPRMVDSVHATLLEEYDVDPDTCKEDLLKFLQDLAAEGLIEVRDEAAE